MDLKAGHSASGSEGNILAAAGLPCVDGAGVEGGDLHSSREWMRLSSLPRRAKIAAQFLRRLAAGEITLPGPRP
jgi:glutamate carboxypeptidase